MALIIPRPIGPPNRIVREGSPVIQYDWESDVQRLTWPHLVERELDSIEHHSWGGRWRRFLSLFAIVTVVACQANLGVSTSQPVPETAHPVTTMTEDGITTTTTEYASKTTCSGLQWSVAAGATMCGESSEWADQLWEVLKEFGRLARGILPAGFQQVD